MLVTITPFDKRPGGLESCTGSRSPSNIAPHRRHTAWLWSCGVPSTQAGPWTAHTATQPDADAHIKRVLDRGQGEGGIVVTQRVIEMLRRRMGIVLVASSQDHQAGTSGLAPCAVQVWLSLGPGSTPMDRHNSACGLCT